MLFRIASSAFLALAFSLLPLAQAQSNEVIPMDSTPTEGLTGLPGVGPYVVIGAPFCADVVTTRTQALADGNRLQNMRTVHVCRDSAGRTRLEIMPTVSARETTVVHTPESIQIFDPTANREITLNPSHHSISTHSVRFVPMPATPPPANPSGAPIWSQVPRNNTHVASRAGDDLVEENLGEQPIHGFVAKGTKITRTIPAGHMGNDLPVIITTERWFCDDLKSLLLLKQSDPRLGDTVNEVTNIVPGEPDPTLFQIPPGYPSLDLLLPKRTPTATP